MFNDRKEGFVISRDGYILATNEVATYSLSGYVKLGAEAVTSHRFHYFPMSLVTLNIVKLDSLELEIAKLSSIIKNQTEVILKTPKVKRNPKPTLDYIASVTKLRSEMSSLLLKFYTSSLTSCQDDNVEKHIAINERGSIGVVEVVYEKDDESGCKRIASAEMLPTVEGTEWVISRSSKIAEKAEAALRSTKTKEELLRLLQKINLIKEGTWLTPEQYMDKHNILGFMKKAQTKELEY